MADIADQRSRSQGRLLHALKSAGPQTAGTLGERLGMTAPGARQHLVRLAKLGLVDSQDRPVARGRPRKYWHLTERGHGRFPDRHDDLTLELLDATRQVFGPDGLDRLIRHREAETLARYRRAVGAHEALADRVSALANLRSQEGYMAAWTCEPEGGFLLVENHCPICAAASACQGFCRSELEIFRAVLGPGVAVERTDHIVAGARRCAYRIGVEGP